MAQDDFKPKLRRIGDTASNEQLRTNTQVLRESGRPGADAARQRGHITSAMPKRGMGTGVRATPALSHPEVAASSSRRATPASLPVISVQCVLT